MKKDGLTLHKIKENQQVHFTSPYGNHYYILISWTGSMEDVFVLAHELGHAGHFKYTNEAQNVFNTDPSLYFIEAPSTMNEMLLANHLLKNTKDLKFKRWVISSIEIGRAHV